MYTLNTIDRPAVYDARGNGDGETVPTLTGDHENRITDYTAICIENAFGLRETDVAEGEKILYEIGNILEERGDYYSAETRDKVLRILWEAYGEASLVEWCLGVLDSLQQEKILRQGMHEGRVPRKTEKEHGQLGNASRPIPQDVAKWLLRVVRQNGENGCSSQRSELFEQQCGKPSAFVPKLSQFSTQTPGELFDMWRSGEGLWLLQQALSQVQKIWRSSMGEREKGGDAMRAIRRLTPLPPRSGTLPRTSGRMERHRGLYRY